MRSRTRRISAAGTWHRTSQPCSTLTVLCNSIDTFSRSMSNRARRSSVAKARCRLIGGDSHRLHEEIIAAGGLLTAGRFSRLNVGPGQGGAGRRWCVVPRHEVPRTMSPSAADAPLNAAFGQLAGLELDMKALAEITRPEELRAQACSL